MKGILLLDIIIVIAVLVMIGITATLGIVILDDFEASTTDLPNFNTTHIANVKATIITFNEGSVLIFFGLIAAAIISAYSLRQHPAYMIFSVILLYISAYIVAAFSNMFSDFTADASMVVAASNFPMLQALMDNIVPITFISGILIIIAMYAKTGGEQQI